MVYGGGFGAQRRAGITDLWEELTLQELFEPCRLCKASADIYNLGSKMLKVFSPERLFPGRSMGQVMRSVSYGKMLQVPDEVSSLNDVGPALKSHKEFTSTFTGSWKLSRTFTVIAVLQSNTTSFTIYWLEDTIKYPFNINTQFEPKSREEEKGLFSASTGIAPQQRVLQHKLFKIYFSTAATTIFGMWPSCS